MKKSKQKKGVSTREKGEVRILVVCMQNLVFLYFR